MRLICPNCDAHYEVESRLIPENGRDVQCSSCGDTWFQAPPSEEDDQKPDLDNDIFAAPSGEDNTLRGQDDAPEVTTESESETGEAVEETETSHRPTEPERASLDAAVLDVLRQEAERETQARIDEGSTVIEAPSDTDLQSTEADLENSSEEPSPSTLPEQEEIVRERTARLRGIEPEDLSDGSPTTRRDLLPDIEEINSTLRATSDRKSGEADENAEEDAQKGRSGFRTGFSLIIVIVTLLLLLYSFAPQIGQKVPAAQPALESFVRTADQGRMKVDAFMEAVIEKMNSSEEPTE